jgi:gamma-glutamylcyclotransferase (GGCT)/AIG2-like uncharacterized protein YtfP
MNYFAYGSNMDLSQMKERCSSFKILGKVKLEGFKLDFTRKSSFWSGGVADIVKSPGSHAWGILYELAEECLDSLDIYEGCPKYYKRRKVSVEYNGNMVEAIAYEVVNKESFIPPSKKYIDAMIKAGKDNNFPEDYIGFLKSIETSK